jgi:hypothetical protein
MRGGPLAIAYVAVVCGCSYDWTYAAGGSPDAADSASPADGQADAPGDSGATDAPPDSANDSAASDSTPPPDCAALEAQVRQDRAIAIKCVSGTTACTTTVQDECGCAVVVGDGAAVATQNYVSAVQQLKTSCHNVVIGCQACGPKPTLGLCVLSDGGGSQLACYQ